MECCSLDFSIELLALLSLLRDSHAVLSQFGPLEPFASVLRRHCGSDKAAAGSNRLTAWIDGQLALLLAQAEFSDSLQQFAPPSAPQPFPKHVSPFLSPSLHQPSYCLFASASVRQALLPQAPPRAVGFAQLLALDAVAQLCGVQWVPFALARVEDRLDQAFGGLREQVVRCPAVSAPREEDIAAQFYQMRKALALPADSPFEGIAGLFVQLANAARFLRLLENAQNRLRLAGSAETPQSLLAAMRSATQSARAQSSSQPASRALGMAERAEQGLEARLSGRRTESAWRVPLFARAAQMLAQDELFCAKLPVFVDRFVVTLFGKLEEWEKANVESVMGTVESVLAFLLTVTRCAMRFFDEGECMKVGQAARLEGSSWRTARRRR